MKTRPPKQNLQAIERKLAENTGQDLAAWLERVRRSGAADVKSATAWLKREHGLGFFQAQVVAREAFGRPATADYQAPGALVAALYSGRHAPLRPLHDAAIALARAQGKGVHISVCKGYVSAYADRQFAVFKPRRGALEVELFLGKTKRGPRRTLRLQSAVALKSELPALLAVAYAAAT